MTPDAQTADEYVVLLDEQDQPCGQALKGEVHTTSTPLHLAFSCWVLDEEGRILITQRAATKQTWPGIWTNSFCGHPAPGEAIEDAVRRRAEQELGARLTGLRLALPDFRYTATMDDGVMENEFCPVFVAQLDDDLEPDHHEIADSRWLDVSDLLVTTLEHEDEFSPWLLMQLPELLAGGHLEAATVTG
jgi:isopentenyl-diphosphate delta-isomerase